jgi:pyruvate, water dikinase
LLGTYVHFVVDPCGYRVEPATAEQVDIFLESLRPKQPQSPVRDLTVRQILPLGQLGFADSAAFGAKAANVAELAKILPAGMTPDGCAVPFSFYDEFMKANHLYDQAAAMMADPAFGSDLQQRDAALAQFRRSVRLGLVPDWMVKALDQMVALFPPGTSLRCRSSTNNEDLPGFNGAGLYDSYTHHPDEGHISKTLKQVWASLWNARAFDERDFYRIDHLTTAMAVLVHPNYQDEQLNGVAVTQNIYDPNWPGSYVNVQIGEDLVTNPGEASSPEEFLVAYLAGDEPYEIQFIRWSSQVPQGQHLMTKPQIYELANRMAVIQEHFARLYGKWPLDADFAMEIEFKITAAGTLAIKQARPWVK